MATIVTRCRADCWGFLFRGVVSVWEPREPPCAVATQGRTSPRCSGEGCARSDYPPHSLLETKVAPATTVSFHDHPRRRTSCSPEPSIRRARDRRKTQQQPPTRETPASMRSTRFQAPPPDASRTAPTATGHRKTTRFPAMLARAMTDAADRAPPPDPWLRPR